MNSKNNLYRNLPSVDKLLREEWIKEYTKQFSRDHLKVMVNAVLDDMRTEISNGELKTTDEDIFKIIEKKLEHKLDVYHDTYIKKVINCTGVVIHTNIGRSPLPSFVIKKIEEYATRYINLEFSLETGARSSRHLILDSTISKLFPGYKAIVVNNNAAAVMLALNTFALNKEVVISRGELVEIGGSFRIPDVMEKSGAILREVGTTNRTRITDYSNAVNDKTGLIMTVHPSNYKITGFTEKTEPWELIDIYEETGIPIFHDMGSGNLFPKDEIDIEDEVNLAVLAEKGIPIISFSADKLMGGCQAGIILVKEEFSKGLIENQLHRALRVGKITYLILEEILKLYITGAYRRLLPIYQMLKAPASDIMTRIKKVKRKIKNDNLLLETKVGGSLIGGGSAPEQQVRTYLLLISHKNMSISALQKKLRESSTPIITRIEDNNVAIDLRTVFPDEEAELITVLNNI